MAPCILPPVADGCYPTAHAMLLIWGYFAQRLHLVDRLATVPVPQKVVRHAPPRS
jgi:hypothetical protein